ncbi:MAG TPA: FMN-binding protein [Patescibacteria group bacterium]|nr:FMN-binding protein [Patescibacteria group bacterium]
MKKVIIALVAVAVIGGFALFYKMNKSDEPSTTDNSNSANLETTNNTPASYKDGTYTGVVGSASQYGNIQVKVVISGGKITDIQYVDFPSGPGHTAEVTAMAQPALKQEAIAAQSANVNIVSGATQDTQGFIQSLQDALNQAKI